MGAMSRETSLVRISRERTLLTIAVASISSRRFHLRAIALRSMLPNRTRPVSHRSPPWGPPHCDRGRIGKRRHWVPLGKPGGITATITRENGHHPAPATGTAGHVP